MTAAESKKRKVLIVSFAFPPFGGKGSTPQTLPVEIDEATVVGMVADGMSADEKPMFKTVLEKI